jgi:hypothetical protein
MLVDLWRVFTENSLINQINLESKDVDSSIWTDMRSISNTCSDTNSKESEKVDLSEFISSDLRDREAGRLMGTPRNRALFYWIVGRSYLEKIQFLSKQIRRDQDQDTVHIVKRTVCQFTQSFENLSRCIANIESSMINGTPISFPQKGMVYFEIWKLLRAEKELVGYFKIDSFFDQDFRDKHSKQYRVPNSLFDVDQTLNLAQSEINELSHFRNRDSSSYKKMLNSRFYLFDDFDDPILKIDWVLQRLFSISMDTYKEEIFLYENDKN